MYSVVEAGQSLLYLAGMIIQTSMYIFYMHMYISYMYMYMYNDKNGLISLWLACYIIYNTKYEAIAICPTSLNHTSHTTCITTIHFICTYVVHVHIYMNVCVYRCTVVCVCVCVCVFDCKHKAFVTL